MKPSPLAAAQASLALQLHHGARCVQAVQQGRSLSEALSAVPASLRPGVQALSFHALRHLGLSQAVLRQLAPRAPEASVAALMLCALALLLEPDAPGVRYAAHTVVNQAVDAVRSDRRQARQAAFVNACLRRLLRELTPLRAHALDDPVAQWNHPRWWIERLQRDHPAHWQRILEANNQAGPMTLRVNRRRAQRADIAQALEALGVSSRPVGEDGLELSRALPVEQLPGFAQGQVSVQDEAAQMAAGLLLQDRRWVGGERVLDACAAPGGKTAHLLERADLDLFALDVDPQRCERIRDTLQRLGLSAEVRGADAAQPADWWDGRAFDAILLDAPCTASGIVRRHPDVRWLRRESDVAALADTQRRLLDALWPLVKPGGRLVYATCSVFRAEGDEQATAFLQRHTDALLRTSPGHLWPGKAGRSDQFNDNEPGGHDGFFFASFDKSAA